MSAAEFARIGLGGVFALAGVIACVLGALAILRLRDFYTRLHGFTLIHALGAPLLLLGLAIAAWDWRIAAKLVLLGLLIAVVAPVAAHLMASGAHGAGLAPDQADANARDAT